MAQPYISWSDVRSVLANVDSYDSKIALPEQDFTATGDTNEYALDDCGYVGRLYRNGVDLGDAKSLVSGVVGDGDWFYDDEDDKLTINSTADPTGLRWEAATDTLANLQALYMNKGAEMFEGILDPRFPRPLPKSSRTYSGGDYEAPVVNTCALFAAREAILATDPGSPDLMRIENQLLNEAGTGIVDMIRAGTFKFGFETTESDKEGEIVEVTTNAATTGYPKETFGECTVQFARLKVTIGTGGTITWGTANTTVTYGVTDADGNTIVSDDLIDITQIQPVGYGVSIAWADGVYTANDAWYIYMRQHSTTSGPVGSIGLRRV